MKKNQFIMMGIAGILFLAGCPTPTDSTADGSTLSTHNDPLYLSSFQSDYAGYETEGGQSWWEFTVEDAETLNSEDWKIYTANNHYLPTLMMASTDIPGGWSLTEGDIIRIHSDKYGYTGPDDRLSSNDGGDGKYDFVYTDYTPNERSGIIWIEDSNSNVMDIIFYNRIGDTAVMPTNSDSIAAIDSAIALGEWPGTEISTSFEYDSSINIAALVTATQEGNAATDWNGTTIP